MKITSFHWMSITRNELSKIPRFNLSTLESMLTPLESILKISLTIILNSYLEWCRKEIGIKTLKGKLIK